MNTTTIGLLCIIFATIFDAIVPILIQEGNVEVYSFIFLLSLVSIILSFFHLDYKDKKFIDTVKESLKNISFDIKTIKYGVLRYIFFILFTFANLYIDTGIYNSLSTSQIIFLTLINNRSEHTNITILELIGFITIIIALFRVVYDAVYKNGKSMNKNILYGSIAFVFALSIMQYIDTGLSSIIKNPYNDTLSTSVVMFILSSVVLFIRHVYYKVKLSFQFSFKYLSKLLYLITFPILIGNYIPDLLFFASYDYLNIIVILMFMLFQSLLGFGLDKLYYNINFTPAIITNIALLSIGMCVSIYGYYKANKTVTPTNKN
jgi:drug/metabolite transporter (DMT)-like permease